MSWIVPVAITWRAHLTKLLYGKFVVDGAKLDEVDEMWVRYIGCSNMHGVGFQWLPSVGKSEAVSQSGFGIHFTGKPSMTGAPSHSHLSGRRVGPPPTQSTQCGDRNLAMALSCTCLWLNPPSTLPGEWGVGSGDDQMLSCTEYRQGRTLRPPHAVSTATARYCHSGRCGGPGSLILAPGRFRRCKKMPRYFWPIP
jgi:hypothetical protein